MINWMSYAIPARFKLARRKMRKRANYLDWIEHWIKAGNKAHLEKIGIKAKDIAMVEGRMKKNENPQLPQTQ